MSTNGVLSFGSSFSVFIPDTFPVAFGRLIAPLWEDSDNRMGGQVYYRLTQEQSLLDQVAANISDAFGVEFSPTSAFVATWNALPQINAPPDIVCKSR